MRQLRVTDCRHNSKNKFGQASLIDLTIYGEEKADVSPLPRERAVVPTLLSPRSSAIADTFELSSVPQSVGYDIVHPVNSKGTASVTSEVDLALMELGLPLELVQASRPKKKVQYNICIYIR